MQAEFYGDIHLEDYEKFLCELSASPEIRRHPKILIDQREGQMRVPEGSAEGHSHFVREMEEHLGTCRVAVVAGSRRDYEINRSFEEASRGMTLYVGKVFMEIESARRWLEER